MIKSIIAFWNGEEITNSDLKINLNIYSFELMLNVLNFLSLSKNFESLEIFEKVLSFASQFETSNRKFFIYLNILNLFLSMEDTDIEKNISSETIPKLLKIFDVCHGCDILHSKVFQILRKIPLKISSDKEISNSLKNFCYFVKIENNSNSKSKIGNVSLHFIYQLMEFFDFSGGNEYDRILMTWMDELKDLFGKKLMMESELSDFEESQIKNSGFEIKTDFNFFGSNENQDLEENKPKLFDFDFTQPVKSLNKSGSNEFGLSNDYNDINLKRKKSGFSDFDFEEEKSKKNEFSSESPIVSSKSSSKKSKLLNLKVNSIFEFEKTSESFNKKKADLKIKAGR